MSDSFNLDLRSAEEEIDIPDEFDGQVTLGVLNGTTPDSEWIGEIQRGNILFLAVDGDLNKLAAGFAKDVKEDGATLMHFRDFLVITPPGIGIDTDRL